MTVSDPGCVTSFQQVSKLRSDMVSEVGAPGATSGCSSSVGMFWGPEGRLSGSSTYRRSREDTVPTRSLVQLPRLTQSRLNRSSASLLAQRQAPELDSAATSLLEVLHTLLRSIRSDMDNFMKSMRAMDPPADKTVHHVGQGGPRYYSPGVAIEDFEFFAHEREADADREAAQAATALARERHCAIADKQLYHFDRRKQTRSSKVSKSYPNRRNSKAAAAEAEAETARIERHRRKIEHLLHVLQDEIAKETRREIEFLEYTGPDRLGSRQSRRRMALVVKARYEAADRIMRILEEYRIVVGMEAADYLLRTIAEGKALS